MDYCCSSLTASHCGPVTCTALKQVINWVECYWHFSLISCHAAFHLASDQSKYEIRTATAHEYLRRRTGRKSCAEQLTPDHVSLLNLLHMCIVFLPGAHGIVAKLRESTNLRLREIPTIHRSKMWQFEGPLTQEG